MLFLIYFNIVVNSKIIDTEEEVRFIYMYMWLLKSWFLKTQEDQKWTFKRKKYDIELRIKN